MDGSKFYPTSPCVAYVSSVALASNYTLLNLAFDSRVGIIKDAGNIIAKDGTVKVFTLNTYNSVYVSGDVRSLFDNMITILY